MFSMNFPFHRGTAESGHYYSFVQERKEQSRWISFNDTLVQDFDFATMESECFGGFAEVTEPGKKPYLKSNNAYLLFYDRIQPQGADASANAAQLLNQSATATADAEEFRVKRSRALPEEPAQLSADEKRALTDNSQYLRAFLLLDDLSVASTLGFARLGVSQSNDSGLALQSFQLYVRSSFHTFLHGRACSKHSVHLKDIVAFLSNSLDAQHWLFQFLLSDDQRLLYDFFIACFSPEAVSFAGRIVGALLSSGSLLPRPEPSSLDEEASTYLHSESLKEWDITLIHALCSALSSSLGLSNANRIQSLLQLVNEFIRLDHCNAHRFVDSGAMSCLLSFILKEQAYHATLLLEDRKIPVERPPYNLIPHIVATALESVTDTANVFARAKLELTNASFLSGVNGLSGEIAHSEPQRDHPMIENFGILLKLATFDSALPSNSIPRGSPVVDPFCVILRLLATDDDELVKQLSSTSINFAAQTDDAHLREFCCNPIIFTLLSEEAFASTSFHIAQSLIDVVSRDQATYEGKSSIIRTCSQAAKKLNKLIDFFLSENRFLFVFQSLLAPYPEETRASSRAFVLALSGEKSFGKHPLDDKPPQNWTKSEVLQRRVTCLTAGLCLTLNEVADIANGIYASADTLRYGKSRLVQFFYVLRRCLILPCGFEELKKYLVEFSRIAAAVLQPIDDIDRSCYRDLNKIRLSHFW